MEKYIVTEHHGGLDIIVKGVFNTIYEAIEWLRKEAQVALVEKERAYRKYVSLDEVNSDGGALTYEICEADGELEDVDA
jgi:hypothetical protein